MQQLLRRIVDFFLAIAIVFPILVLAGVIVSALIEENKRRKEEVAQRELHERLMALR